MSDKMKHTPGPWAVGYGNGISGPRVAPTVYLDHVKDMVDVPVRAGNHAVAWVLSSMPDERIEADARLIAAAPELLEALQHAKNSLVAFKFLPGERNAWEDHDEVNLEAVEAAIAKATGGNDAP